MDLFAKPNHLLITSIWRFLLSLGYGRLSLEKHKLSNFWGLQLENTKLYLYYPLVYSTWQKCVEQPHPPPFTHSYDVLQRLRKGNKDIWQWYHTIVLKLIVYRFHHNIKVALSHDIIYIYNVLDGFRSKYITK